MSPLRAFFALWPDEAARDRLAALAAVSPRATRAADLHLTVCFVGATAARDLDALASLGASLPVAPFVVSVGRCARWPEAGVEVALASSPDPGLGALREALLARLAGANRRLDDRRGGDYRAHVTLARTGAVAPPARPAAAIAWRADALTLAVSDPVPGSSRYRIVATLPFAGASVD